MLDERRVSVAAPNDTGGGNHAPVAIWRPRNAPLLRHSNERAKSLENRISDAITGFAGSMGFVYIHVVGGDLSLNVRDDQSEPS